MCDLRELIVIRKDGTHDTYKSEKILLACNKSAVRARGYNVESQTDNCLTTTECNQLLQRVEEKLLARKTSRIRTSYLHTIIENVLNDIAPDVGKAYSNYHSFRMSQASEWEKIMEQCNEAAQYGDRQNANADSSLASTLKCYSADYLETSRFEQFFLTSEERQLAKEGYIYFHDKNARQIYPMNCCLFNCSYVLEHGCEINGITYQKPKSLDVTFDVLGDIIMMGASQQYGGFTIPRVDSIIAPYAEREYQTLKQKYISLGVTEETAAETAEKDVDYILHQGFQGWEMKFNTVASSRGDYPFTTVSFGLDTSKWGIMASKAILQVRREGQGTPGKKKPVLFPKLVFLYDKNLHGKGKPLEEVYEEGIKCSAKTMYPDWLSLTGEGYVPSMYKKYGIAGVISPMGCRAFLSPWYERGGMYPADETDLPVFEGRFNIGVVSLNLPMILRKSQVEQKDFYSLLTYCLEIIRNFHKRMYEYLGNLPANRNPLGFCYGGFYGGHLKPTDKIAPLLESATASFGITALNELQRLYDGFSLYEASQKYRKETNFSFFALEVMKFINQKIDEFKKADHRLYAIYGTPAEKLCGTQIKQFRAKYGTIQDVSSRAYVSNSFHCHVTENISPIEKQDAEKLFWDYFNGGKIQYCKYKLGYNVIAIKTLIERAMEMGFYEGVNLSLNYCDDCGYSQVDMGNVCPRCGSIHITQIDRMNGYLSYSRIGKYVDDSNLCTKFNNAKQIEIQERVSM